MTVLALVVLILALLVGLVGVILPVLPGVPVAAVGVVLAAWIVGFQRFGVLELGDDVGLAVLAQIIDLAGNWVGARFYGAKRAGLWGGVLGSLVGLLFFPPFGFLLGALVGAVLFELLGGRPLDEALRAGIGAFVGTLGGTIAKLLIVVAMAVVSIPRLL
ncbi:MAG: DUF456 domain-containing protein [Deinococcales bacterium]